MDKKALCKKNLPRLPVEREFRHSVKKKGGKKKRKKNSNISMKPTDGRRVAFKLIDVLRKGSRDLRASSNPITLINVRMAVGFCYSRRNNIPLFAYKGEKDCNVQKYNTLSIEIDISSIDVKKKNGFKIPMKTCVL